MKYAYIRNHILSGSVLSAHRTSRQKGWNLNVRSNHRRTYHHVGIWHWPAYWGRPHSHTSFNRLDRHRYPVTPRQASNLSPQVPRWEVHHGQFTRTAHQARDRRVWGPKTLVLAVVLFVSYAVRELRMSIDLADDHRSDWDTSDAS